MATINPIYTTRNGKVTKNGNRFAKIKYVRAFGAYFATFGKIAADHTTDAKQYRYEVGQEAQMEADAAKFIAA